MKKATTRMTIIIVLLVVVVVGYYAYLSNRDKSSQEETTLTEVQSTLSRDLSKDYPPTPKEVIKYYNKLLRCLYNEDSTDEELEALGMKARELYDADLLANNELESYMTNLKADVKSSKDSGRRFTAFNLASSTNVEIFERDGYSFAKIMCGYTVLQDGQSRTTNQIYLLRKDENKQWKIFGWEDAEKLNAQTE